MEHFLVPSPASRSRPPHRDEINEGHQTPLSARSPFRRDFFSSLFDLHCPHCQVYPMYLWRERLCMSCWHSLGQLKNAELITTTLSLPFPTWALTSLDDGPGPGLKHLKRRNHGIAEELWARAWIEAFDLLPIERPQLVIPIPWSNWKPPHLVWRLGEILSPYLIKRGMTWAPILEKVPRVWGTPQKSKKEDERRNESPRFRQIQSAPWATVTSAPSPRANGPSRALLFDDIVTTGATLLQAQQGIRGAASSPRIEVLGALTLAYTPRYFPKQQTQEGAVAYQQKDSSPEDRYV